MNVNIPEQSEPKLKGIWLVVHSTNSLFVLWRGEDQ